MQSHPPDDGAPSPFHAGEQALQARVGKRDGMERIGRRAIRPFMPEQHRTFFGQLPFLAVGSVDGDGWPWASILAGAPGFIGSPDPATLTVAAQPFADDPLGQILRPGAPLGLLGIELATRRRNRANGRVTAAEESGFALTVDQSFGNCPKYIQTRQIEPPGAASQTSSGAAERFTALDAAAEAGIAKADTLFVASAAPAAAGSPETHGVDVSHRGGRPGFVKRAGATLTIPDYPGNSFYNTFGNFLLNPKAGLLFPDFATGDLLLLTGTVALDWDPDADVQAHAGAERSWRFTLDHGLRLPGALPFRAAFDAFSPHSLAMGEWPRRG